VLRVKDPAQTGAGEARPSELTSHPILLYDGVCGLCNGSVQFILRHDRDAVFRFAALQSSFAARILARHGADPADLDTVYVLLNHDLTEREAAGKDPAQPDAAGESLFTRSDAVMFVLRQLGGVWGAIAFLMRLIPRPARNWGYNLVARYRYRIFGRYDMCPLPSADTRARFLDL